jgi:hypothetical protein
VKAKKVKAKKVKEYANRLWRTIQTSKKYIDCPVGRNVRWPIYYYIRINLV